MLKDKIKNGFRSFVFKQDSKQLSVEACTLILIIVFCIIATLTDKTFISKNNITNLIDGATLLLVMALGLTFVLLSGSVNLAVGGMLSLSSVLFALFAERLGMWAIAVVLLFGFLEGLAIGGVFNAFKIPSFIATYGMAGLFTSVAVFLSGGTPVVFNSGMLKALRVFNLAVLPGVKLQYLIALLLLILFWFIQKKTAFGKHIVGVGNSPEAMRHIGVNIANVKLLCYGLSGFSTAMGAIILCSRLYAGDPTIGNSYLLLIVAVVIVGGTSLTGGVGGVFNTLLGALAITVLRNAMQIMAIDVYYQSVVVGAVMILAVAVSLDRKQVLIVK